MKKPLKNIELRGNDPTGHGYYGAIRGTRKHKGVDVVSVKGENVFSMTHGTVTKLGYPYAKNLNFRYVEITNDEFRIRYMYIKPTVKLHDRIFEGNIIGKAQDIANYWNPKMKNHIHIEVYKNTLLTDAEPLILDSN